MSADMSFKDLVDMEETEEAMPFGQFAAKIDLYGGILNEEMAVTDINKKINLYKKMLVDYIKDSEMNYDGATCVDVAKFVYAYVKELGLFSEKGFDELKETLEEIKEGDGTLSAKESFKFLLNYSYKIEILENNGELENLENEALKEEKNEEIEK